MAIDGTFDVIAHGCNCFCTMRSGIAPDMAQVFGCDNYVLEDWSMKGDINKLGQIEFKRFEINNGANSFMEGKPLIVVNCYTQYYNKKNNPSGRDAVNFDIDAFRLCLRKMNFQFKGKHIGLPKIGSGHGGGDWRDIEPIILEELRDCRVTIVEWDESKTRSKRFVK